MKLSLHNALGICSSNIVYLQHSLHMGMSHCSQMKLSSERQSLQEITSSGQHRSVCVSLFCEDLNDSATDAPFFSGLMRFVLTSRFHSKQDSCKSGAVMVAAPKCFA